MSQSKRIFLGVAIATLWVGSMALSACAAPDRSAKAENPARSPRNFDTQEMLEAHNEWRSRVGVPPLSWSEDLADYAEQWAQQLADRGFDMEHRPNNRYGENIYWSAGRSASPTDVVNSWGEEVADYNYQNNTCDGVCGHYTQVVWENTQEVGCAVVRGTHPEYRTQEVWVCNYNPPGNYVGERPY